MAGQDGSAAFIGFRWLFLQAAGRHRVDGHIAALAIGDAVALLIIDPTYVGLGRISSIYLLDALAHFILLAGWGIAFLMRARADWAARHRRTIRW